MRLGMCMRKKTKMLNKSKEYMFPVDQVKTRTYCYVV